EGMAGPISDEQKEYLDTILAKSDQLHQLISKLLDVSRLEVSSVQLARSPVDLKVLLGDVVRSLSPQLRRKRTRLVLSISDQLPTLQADRDKLRQVLLNLISNAIKFTRDEGEVDVAAEPAKSEGGDLRVLLSVSDNGIGIPTDLHDKVFDAFYQVDNSSTRQHEGSGLGLLLVRRYIAAHGGKVWIEDRPQGGTIFRILLPVSG
ncbi:MAG TPA: HAMP domain-containing sensor histidine kinase, partial [Pseudomonadota bacterium]|nr:HAMP domain-containing sensor histidine kinase [Pseudomonadota bacterium]